MTRKDFVLIADVIANLDEDKLNREEIAQAFMTRLRSTNPQFNAERFIAAATKEGS